jgi:repressor LexA
MRSSKEVIRLIRDLREKKRMSVEEFARRVGIAKSTLSRYENGQRDFPINELGTYAAILDTTIEHLLGIEPRRESARIPLVGTICAGDGLLAESNIEDYVHYPFPNKRQPDYALRVKGDSMIGAGIDDGDIVYMRHAQWADHSGQIVAALLGDGESGTLKRIKWGESSRVLLIPENPNYSPIETTFGRVVVCGVYMGHFKPEQGGQ